MRCCRYFLKKKEKENNNVSRLRADRGNLISDASQLLLFEQNIGKIMLFWRANEEFFFIIIIIIKNSTRNFPFSNRFESKKTKTKKTKKAKKNNDKVMNLRTASARQLRDQGASAGAPMTSPVEVTSKRGDYARRCRDLMYFCFF